MAALDGHSCLGRMAPQCKSLAHGALVRVLPQRKLVLILVKCSCDPRLPGLAATYKPQEELSAAKT